MSESDMTPTENRPQELMTRTMFFRALLKGLVLYLAFSALYTLIAPLQRGLVPSFHNGVLAGRVRLAQDYVLNAALLVNDHIIMSATTDTYNIVVLGSSEMWGARAPADETIPAYMDALHMVAADGRPVRVYNLSYPVPYALKDLIILDVLLEHHIPIDLIIFSVFDETFTYFNHPHYLVHGNAPLEMAVIKKYGLYSAYHYVRADIGRAVPFTQRLSEDASAWRDWLYGQLRGIKWTLTRDEFVGVSQEYLQHKPILSKFEDVLELDRMPHPLDPEFIRVFQQVRQDYGIPVLILEAPIPYNANEFTPWLQEQTAAFGLPLLDCWNTFREPAAFENLFHPGLAIHPVYARVLARYLIDPRMAVVDDGLPLTAPADFAAPAETCALYLSDTIES